MIDVPHTPCSYLVGLCDWSAYESILCWLPLRENALLKIQKKQIHPASRVELFFFNIKQMPMQMLQQSIDVLRPFLLHDKKLA